MENCIDLPLLHLLLVGGRRPSGEESREGVDAAWGGGGGASPGGVAGMGGDLSGRAGRRSIPYPWLLLQVFFSIASLARVGT